MGRHAAECSGTWFPTSLVVRWTLWAVAEDERRRRKRADEWLETEHERVAKRCRRWHWLLRCTPPTLDELRERYEQEPLWSPGPSLQPNPYRAILEWDGGAHRAILLDLADLAREAQRGGAQRVYLTRGDVVALPALSSVPKEAPSDA